MRTLQSELESWKEHQLNLLYDDFIKTTDALIDLKFSLEPDGFDLDFETYGDQAFDEFCTENASWYR